MAKVDGRRNNGGHRNGGRKSKAEEQKLVEKLSPFEADALEQLEKAVKEGHKWAIALYMGYMYGKPRETKDVNLVAEQPLFPDV